MRDPIRAAASFQRRTRAEASGGSSFAGAAHTRFTEDWVFATIRSADQEVRYDLRSLRARSRELVRNNDTAARYVSLVDEQEMGWEGIRLQAYVTKPDGMLDLGINQRIEDAWAEWCERCTVDGRHSFVDVLSLLARNRPTDGEFLARMLPFRGNRFGFALALLDPDQLDETLNQPAGDGKPEIRMGVEVDAWQRPLAFHVWDHHPADFGVSAARDRRRIRLPADQILHSYHANRVGQTRGIPWFAPALMKLRHIAGYEEAEIIASRMAACKSGYITTAPEAVQDPNVTPAQTAEDVEIHFEMEPGTMDKLPPGWTFTAFDPQHPTNAFKDFHKSMVRGVANGLGVAYTSLANDLEGVNFSSIRAGLLNERDAWRRLQWKDIRHFCRPIYRTWLKWALTTGALELPMRNRDRWSAHRWQPRGWPWVDPEKDVNAAAKELAIGVNSLTRICGDRGVDFEEILLERAMEIRLAKELGVPITTNLSASAKQSEPREDGDRTDDDEDAEASTSTRAIELSEVLEQRLRGSRIAALLASTTNGNGRH